MNKEDIIEQKWISIVGKELYSKIKIGIDKDGWLNDWLKLIPTQQLFMFDGRFNNNELRPRTLRGIDDNLGWSKPKIDGLPKITGEYIFLSPNKKQHTVYVSVPITKVEENHLLNDFTHYKPLKIEPLPLH